jgi:hypothetical protein
VRVSSRVGNAPTYIATTSGDTIHADVTGEYKEIDSFILDPKLGRFDKKVRALKFEGTPRHVLRADMLKYSEQRDIYVSEWKPSGIYELKESDGLVYQCVVGHETLVASDVKDIAEYIAEKSLPEYTPLDEFHSDLVDVSGTVLGVTSFVLFMILISARR